MLKQLCENIFHTSCDWNACDRRDKYNRTIKQKRLSSASNINFHQLKHVHDVVKFLKETTLFHWSNLNCVSRTKLCQNYSCGNEPKLIYTCFNSLNKIHYMFQTSSRAFINATCGLQKTASKFDIG
jgi:hypothetical protein